MTWTFSKEEKKKNAREKNLWKRSFSVVSVVDARSTELVATLKENNGVINEPKLQKSGRSFRNIIQMTFPHSSKQMQIE